MPSTSIRRRTVTAAPRPLHRRLPRVSLVAVSALLLGTACGETRSPSADSATGGATSPAAASDTLQAAVITQAVLNDSDDPAIWINPAAPEQSLVVGTDKGDSTGGLYVFRLDGTIDSARTRRPLMRPNNVDIVDGFVMGRDTVSIAVTTERGKQALRVYRLPDMTPIDGGGIPVFDGDVTRAPMGVAVHRRASDGAVFAIVGGKAGPTDGYLWQYRLVANATGVVQGTKVRAFGRYSGTKEIEAIAVDRTLGFVYYSDETVGVRQYRADPDAPGANEELALFGTAGFVSDHEGIGIYPTSDSTGYLLISDQQGQRLRVFRREGSAGAPYAHQLLAVIPVSARETDGLEVTATPLGPRFPEGLLVMMSTDRTFHFFDWRDIKARIARRDTVVTR
ncbi:MAG: phytase [Gemmatimonas sp.]|uniref:phytase n=1 Tax=Gemmatimonas sp. TaxID=1962908 RepID=UPI0022C32041|nr:phytase [Gemmatimonas sp.]MCZ8012825.1 phytase [Gemmatimonas sp.]MCZ8268201.1 phytase [Gemmatimonas sp.]